MYDIITIWHRGKDYKLTVIEIRPETYGSLVDTDVEVELDVSEEYRRQQEELGRVSASTTSAASARTLRETTNSFGSSKESVHVVASPAAETNNKPLPALPPEPAADELETIYCKDS